MSSIPSDDILMKYASGVLDPALRMLVTRHLELSPGTRSLLTQWDELGGHLLDAEEGVALTAGRLDQALSLIGREAASSPAAAGFPALETLNWRWAGPGRAIANIDVPGSQLKSYALRIAPGKAMLQHSHAAEEWTLIVQGAYRDESGEYAAGAFIEEDEATNHRPVATGDTECICLAVMSGPLSAPGFVGKAARWFMG